MSLQASIKVGYDRAFATIVDANVTSLIVIAPAIIGVRRCIILATAELGVWMINIDLLGVQEMMRAAVNSLRPLAVNKKPFLVGVTVSLTALNLRANGRPRTGSQMTGYKRKLKTS